MRGIKTKRRRFLLVSYLLTAVAALSVLAWVNWQTAKSYRQAVNNSYQHAFSELVTALSEMDTALQKSLYATSPGMVSQVCTEIFGKAMTAQMSLGSLPFSTQELEQTAGFISRVGDYAFALSRSAAAGKGYSGEELENLRSLSGTAELLSANMKALQAELSDGRLTMDELENAEKRLDAAGDGTAQASVLSGSVRLIEQEFPEIPSLVYDGPFSEHIKNRSPAALEGLPEVSQEEALKAAAVFTGLNPERLRFAGESKGELPCLWFEAGTGGNTLSVAVTKQGGKPLNMLSSRQPGPGDLSDDEALATAYRFLESRGYRDMVETYRIRQGNVITFNFAWRQGKVLCYSDLIKVGIADGSGSVCSFEAQGYLMCHRERELALPAATREQAVQQVPETLEILSAQLALVPSDGQIEKLCWEFKCAGEQDRHCLIYVSAETGQQEKILLLIEDETGALAI